MDPFEVGWNVDFAALASADERFAFFYQSSSRSIDFTDSRAVRQLAQSQLRVRFGLDVDIPAGRLCPALPNRAAYIDWIVGLVRSAQPGLAVRDGGLDRDDDGRTGWDEDATPLRGLDIGVGASCIYPLLAVSMVDRCSMIGTELDEFSLECARANVTRNRLDDRIALFRASRDGPILPVDQLESQPIDFTVCNPPFYTSAAEIEASAVLKQGGPTAVCTGAAVEMVTDGGDIGFATRILAESERLGGQCRWFSTLLGKKSSVGMLVAELRNREVTNYAIGTIDPGGRTRRWCVAWSFQPWRPPFKWARPETVDRTLWPARTEMLVTVAGEPKADHVGRLGLLLQTVGASWRRVGGDTGVFLATGNVWSRSARRKRTRDVAELGLDEGRGGDRSDVVVTAESALFIARISLVGAEGGDRLGSTMLVEWVKGDKYADFNSFCGFVRARLRPGCDGRVVRDGL